MPQVMLEAYVVNNFDARQKLAIRLIGEEVALGSGAQYYDNETLYLVFDDNDITIEDAAYYAAFFKHAYEIPANLVLDQDTDNAEVDHAANRGRLITWLNQFNVQHVSDVDVAEDEDSFTKVVEANNATNNVKAYTSGVPNTFTLFEGL